MPFNKTINILKPLDDEVLREALIWLAIDSQNMSYYFLILQLIQENETWTHHLTASRLLSVSLVSFEGAENIALNHLRRAIELDNDNVELKLELVSFFESPEKLVSEEEVKFIIKNYYRFASKDLQERIDSKKITQATARLEKAAALFYLTDQGKMAMDSGSCDLWRFELAYRDISSMSVGALPKKSKNTSSNKLKAFSDEAFDLLMGNAFNKKSDATRNLLLFIRANLLVGLRPVEWLNTCFINYQHRNALGELLILPDGSTKTSPALEVQNAKHSSIRGNGERRIILLDNLDDVKIQYIHQWIQAINKLKTDDLISLSETEINRKIYGSMQRVMRNLLMKNGSKENIPTIYSTRHQAVANARADGLSQKEIAALFGHSSTNTARRHYGKRTAGYSGRTMRPAPESLQAVRSTIAVRPKAAWAEASPGFG